MATACTVPMLPEEGHRFNPNKLLLDPYACAHFGELKWDDALFGYTVGTEAGDLSFDERDSAPSCRSVLWSTPPSSGSRRPHTTRFPWTARSFTKPHVRGYTKLHPAVPKDERGTFAGLSHPKVIEYIKSLGVTSVELLPVHTFVTDIACPRKGSD